jgi:signal transduction histidine kinase
MPVSSRVQAPDQLVGGARVRRVDSGPLIPARPRPGPTQPAGQDIARWAWDGRQATRVIEATSEGVLVISWDGICEYANESAHRLLAVPSGSLIGSDVHALIHAPHAGHGCVFKDRFADTGEVGFRGSDLFRCGDGRTMHVDVTFNQATGRGPIRSVACLFSDASSRINRELALKDALAQQTAAAAQLRDLNAQKADIIATVSHELRTPLFSVMGYLELVLESPDLSKDTRSHLNVIDQNARRLLSQVESLLLISRIESGRITHNRVPFDLVEVINAVARTQACELKKKNQQLTVELDVPDGTPVMVDGDSTQVDRVLLNLLSNAVKFTGDNGSVYMTVNTSPSWVMVQVVDTGMGIPKAEQPRLFEKFFRSSLSQNEATSGTGLGLAIVKAIVTEHGGTIAVESEEGVGTAVAFTLPRAH